MVHAARVVLVSAAATTVVADRLRQCILARGDSVEPGAAFKAFRGREPSLDALLRHQGMA